jgi:hypothetical protein
MVDGLRLSGVGRLLDDVDGLFIVLVRHRDVGCRSCLELSAGSDCELASSSPRAMSGYELTVYRLSRTGVN